MGKSWIDAFVAVSPPIDEVREEAIRCAEETARQERGERGPLRMPCGLVSGEFSDAAFGVAAEVATRVFEALRTTGKRFKPELCWSTAADLLRAGWQRGQKLVPMEIGRGDPS